MYCFTYVLVAIKGHNIICRSRPDPAGPLGSTILRDTSGHCPLVRVFGYLFNKDVNLIRNSAMLITDVVQVSGRGTSVEFTIDDTLPFDQVIHGLRRYLVDNRGLWSKGNITVNAGLRIASREQLNELKAIIEKESGLTVARFWCSPDTFDQTPGQTPSPDPVAGPQGITPAQTADAARAPEFLRPQENTEPGRPRAHSSHWRRPEIHLPHPG